MFIDDCLGVYLFILQKYEALVGRAGEKNIMFYKEKTQI